MISACMMGSMHALAVKMFAVSADPTFQDNRAKFQEDLQNLFSESLHRLRAPGPQHRE